MLKRWIVTRYPRNRDMCDDNMDAGELPIHHLFPSGHYHPPAHRNCACILQTFEGPEFFDTREPE